MGKTAIVQTGKLGDVLNILPLAKKLSDEKGYPIGFVVAREFASVLDGVSYVTPVVFDGPFIEVGLAMRLAMAFGYDDLLVTQVYGKGIGADVQKTSSFCLDSWRMAGRQSDYGLPLVIDRLPSTHQLALKDALPKDGLPIILVSADGQSAPFHHRERLFSMLRSFSGVAHVVNLAEFKRIPLIELLHLYDEATMLVSIDTAHLHLANARPNLPVLALAANKPSTWHSTPQRKNHAFYCRYDDFPKRIHEMEAVIREIVQPKLYDSSKGVNDSRPTIYHVWSGKEKPDGDTRRRMTVARSSWNRERALYGKWVETEVQRSALVRDSLTIGDMVPMPFIHDMVNLAAKLAGDDDIILLTNSDIGFVTGTASEIAQECAAHGAAWAHRWDFHPLMTKTLATKEEVQRGRWYVGIDVFAFTKRWWMEHRHDLPDFVLGREAWDWILKLLIQESGGQEIHAACYHELHDSLWKNPGTRQNNKGNQYNRGFARRWLEVRNRPLRELANTPFLPAKWPLDRASSEITSPQSPGTDVLIVLGNGSKWNDSELRFCLRGIENFATGLRNVYVIGKDPGFLSDQTIYIPHADPNHSKEHNITYAIEQACNLPHLSEEFVFFNDDHFLLSPVDLARYPYYTKGQLEGAIMLAPAAGYRRALANTVKALTMAKLPTISYEMHMPIRYGKKSFLSLSHWWQQSTTVRDGFLPRSIYGNALNVTPEQSKDCKIQKVNNMEHVERIVTGRHVFSIADDSISYGVADFLSKRFPRKSRFEK